MRVQCFVVMRHLFGILLGAITQCLKVIVCIQKIILCCVKKKQKQTPIKKEIIKKKPNTLILKEKSSVLRMQSHYEGSGVWGICELGWSQGSKPGTFLNRSKNSELNWVQQLDVAPVVSSTPSLVPKLSLQSQRWCELSLHCYHSFTFDFSNKTAGCWKSFHRVSLDSAACELMQRKTPRSTFVPFGSQR